MGRAIIVNSPNLFANENLGEATLVDKIAVSSISIIGADNGVIKGFYDTLSISYTPYNTSMKGVKWEILNAPEGITISGNGRVDVAETASVSSFTVKATSVYDSSISATKVINIVDGANILTFQTLYNGNINSSRTTSIAHQYIHYGSVISCVGGDCLRIKFPPTSPDYQANRWLLKVVEFNTTSLPSNLMTKSALDLTTYISYFPADYTSVSYKKGGSVIDYIIQGESTVCVYVQFGMSSLDACSSGYGQKVGSITKYNWALEFNNTEPVGYILKNPEDIE